MRHSLKIIGTLAVAALALLSACNRSSDETQKAGETRPGMAQPPAPQGNAPAAPSSSDTGGSRGY